MLLKIGRSTWHKLKNDRFVGNSIIAWPLSSFSKLPRNFDRVSFSMFPWMPSSLYFHLPFSELPNWHHHHRLYSSEIIFCLLTLGPNQSFPIQSHLYLEQSANHLTIPSFTGWQSFARCLTDPQYLHDPPLGYNPFSFCSHWPAKWPTCLHTKHVAKGYGLSRYSLIGVQPSYLLERDDDTENFYAPSIHTCNTFPQQVDCPHFLFQYY